MKPIGPQDLLQPLHEPAPLTGFTSTSVACTDQILRSSLTCRGCSALPRLINIWKGSTICRTSKLPGSKDSRPQRGREAACVTYVNTWRKLTQPIHIGRDAGKTLTRETKRTNKKNHSRNFCHASPEIKFRGCHLCSINLCRERKRLAFPSKSDLCAS